MSPMQVKVKIKEENQISKKKLLEEINEAKQMAATEFLKKIKTEKKQRQDKVRMIQARGIEALKQYEEE